MLNAVCCATAYVTLPYLAHVFAQWCIGSFIFPAAGHEDGKHILKHIGRGWRAGLHMVASKASKVVFEEAVLVYWPAGGHSQRLLCRLLQQ